METKKPLHVEWKELDGKAEGSFTARFAHLNRLDGQGDVTLPGAFQSGLKLWVSAYGHESWKGKLPIGTAVIHESGGEVLANGQFLLDTTHGRDAYLTIKAAPEIAQWSYGYQPIDFSFGEHEGKQARFLKKVKVTEVSPVLLGADEDTAVVSIKSALSLEEDGADLLNNIKMFRDRVREKARFRAIQGRPLSVASRSQLEEIEEALVVSAGDLKELLEEKQSDIKAGDSDEAQKLILSFLKHRNAYQMAIR